MVTIPDPFTNVLARAEEAEVDQPRPDDPHYGSRDGQVPVEEPCRACGCRWVTDPEGIIPEGAVDCGFCGVMRGSLHRDASLDEFADGGSVTPAADGTVEYTWAGDSPLTTWSEVFEHARLLVHVDPTVGYVDELGELLDRSIYEMHVYLKSASDRRDERWSA